VAFRLHFVPGRDPTDLLDLPWSTPLATWDHAALITMAQGQSRHVVRFVSQAERAYALKELPESDAHQEYDMLRQIADEKLPVVQPIGLVTSRRGPGGERLDAALITRYLDFSLPYQYLFGVEGGPYLARRLVDAAVVLLVRIHTAGFYWGDCSLANLLFRRDAGSLMAYLVDAETAERRLPLSEELRHADVELARENTAGGLLDLVGAGSLPEDVDVFALADRLASRYHQLWEELTGTLDIDIADRYLIDHRLQRLHELGFDVAELIVEHDGTAGNGGGRLRVTPAVVEEGHHSRELRRLTGIDVQENQARRLLNDINAFGASLAKEGQPPPPQAVVAVRWLAEVYEPIISRIPQELRGHLEPPQLFHELLEHRYYLSEAAGYDVGNDAALASYLESVLRFRRPERVLLTDAPGGEAT
jgi:hypothetical protein